MTLTLKETLYYITLLCLFPSCRDRYSRLIFCKTERLCKKDVQFLERFVLQAVSHLSRQLRICLTKTGHYFSYKICKSPSTNPIPTARYPFNLFAYFPEERYSFTKPIKTVSIDFQSLSHSITKGLSLVANTSSQAQSSSSLSKKNVPTSSIDHLLSASSYRLKLIAFTSLFNSSFKIESNHTKKSLLSFPILRPPQLPICILIIISQNCVFFHLAVICKGGMR